jgi:TfoX/Sxy family transcriptional regulator of competence genes
MAYDEGLAERIREQLTDMPAVTEKKMFGGLSFLVQGNMACGVTNTDTLIVRVGKERYTEAMLRPHSHEMDFTGRAMKGWVSIDEPGYESDEDLAEWLQLGVDHALSLPAK